MQFWRVRQTEVLTFVANDTFTKCTEEPHQKSEAYYALDVGKEVKDNGVARYGVRAQGETLKGQVGWFAELSETDAPRACLFIKRYRETLGFSLGNNRVEPTAFFTATEDEKLIAKLLSGMTKKRPIMTLEFTYIYVNKLNKCKCCLAAILKHDPDIKRLVGKAYGSLPRIPEEDLKIVVEGDAVGADGKPVADDSWKTPDIIK